MHNRGILKNSTALGKNIMFGCYFYFTMPDIRFLFIVIKFMQKSPRTTL